MRRLADQRTYLRWLRPGLGVKRWLLLFAGSLVLLGLAVLLLPRAVDLSGLWGAIGRLIPGQVSPAVPVLLLFIIGGALAAWAIVGINRSLLAGYRRSNPEDVVDVVRRHRQRQRGPKVVAIGGGHGLSTLLRGIKLYTDHITAIVTVTDDGGSSGRLRRDLGVPPPGDFRNCIAALSEAEGLVSQLFQYRFGGEGDLEGHSFGNLYLSAMTAITGSFESALEESSRVLAVRGRVIPSTLKQATLTAEVLVCEPAAAGGDGLGRERLLLVRGESQIPAVRGRIQHLLLEPADVPANPEAIRAILDADMVMIGPGSLYTSVLPNLLVPELAAAIRAAPGRKVYVCNVATQYGETEGYGVGLHVDAIRAHVGGGLFDTVLANARFLEAPPPGAGVDWVYLPEPGRADFDLVARDLVDPRRPWRHDPGKLAQALIELFGA